MSPGQGEPGEGFTNTQPQITPNSLSVSYMHTHRHTHTFMHSHTHTPHTINDDVGLNVL